MSYLTQTTTLPVRVDLGLTLFPLGPLVPPNHIFSVDEPLTLYPKGAVGWFNGIGKVYGNVSATVSHLVIGRRRVRLYANTTGALVKETFCRETDGYYEFLSVLETETYYVVAIDHLGTYLHIIRGPVVPEVS